MNILQLLHKKSKVFYTSIILLGIVNSALYSGILMFINNIVDENKPPYSVEYDWLIFCALILASLASSRIFQTYLTRMTKEIVFEFEMTVLEKLKSVRYENYEKLGSEKIYTAIADGQMLANIPSSFVEGFNATIMCLCSLGYIFFTSPVGGLFVLLILTMLLVFYLWRNKGIGKELVRVRDLQDNYYRYLRDLLAGFREVRMSQVRDRNIYDTYLRQNRLETKDIGIATSIKYLDNELTGSLSWYIVMGTVMFALPKLIDFDTSSTTTFIITVLYLMGPIKTLIGLIPYSTAVKIAIGRMNVFDAELKAAHNERLAEVTKQPGQKHQEFELLEFKNICYTYFDQEKKKTFSLGPIDWQIKKGETVFLTGGNGSGKSTFVNLLTGLYCPKEGQMLINGQKASYLDYLGFKESISAIFTTNYLFSENYDDFELTPGNEKLGQYIELMRMQNILRLNNGKTIFEDKLSKGQQKRLAMIYALMEDRPILVLDEWAAEQDPAFRAYFYTCLLPDLKRMGKTIIAVTHDDNYFLYADRISKFDCGRIVSDLKGGILSPLTASQAV